MDTVSIIFLACTATLLLCIFALNLAYEAQQRHERYIIRKMTSDMQKVEVAMTDAKKVKGY